MDVPRGTRLTADPSPRELLARGAAELGEDPDALGPTLDRLAALADLLALWAARVQLTAHRTPESIARRLVLDALALSNAAPPFQSLVDLGSGAGFPGLPIAIRHPERRVTLVESRERAHHFQRAAVRELSIANADPRHGRAEDLPADPHDVAVAQAAAAPDAVVAWLPRWVRPGGHVLVPGSQTSPAPPATQELLEFRAVPYQVPLGGPHRVLWIAQRR